MLGQGASGTIVHIYKTHTVTLAGSARAFESYLVVKIYLAEVDHINGILF